tara:strand:+ start:38 stop:520 length:483 start_codon:yes stop_codon:yes gene_type:complete
MELMSITACLAVANKCIQGINKACNAGQDIDRCMNNVQRFFQAESDLQTHIKKNKKPPLFKKLTNEKSIRQEGLELWRMRQAMASHRKELYTLITYSYGKEKWQELVQIENELKKERKEAIDKQIEMRRKFADAIFLLLGAIAIIGILVGFVYVLSLGGK